MKKLLFFCAFIFALASTATAAADNNAEIITATESYMAATFGITKINAVVEQVADDFARVKVTTEIPGGADPAWVFLQKKDGKWTGLVLGRSFTTEDYQQLGIPNVLRIP